MDRRGFFARLAAVVVAGLARPQWWHAYNANSGDLSLFNPPSDIARQYRDGLLFHPKAFEMAMEPLGWRGAREEAQRRGGWPY